MRTLCLPAGLPTDDQHKVDTVVSGRRRVAKGEALFKTGQTFKHLYAVRFGHLKSSQISASGVEQVTGFHLAGDLLGMDAIANTGHQGDTVALEDSEV
ncbi:MAG: cyclic nucleotide-binding domain-containing protein, partial [Gammaproteobacteria bacterium]